MIPSGVLDTGLTVLYKPENAVPVVEFVISSLSIYLMLDTNKKLIEALVYCWSTVYKGILIKHGHTISETKPLHWNLGLRILQTSILR